jgi:transcriptional regulator with XRE-family HTH domain
MTAPTRAPRSRQRAARSAQAANGLVDIVGRRIARERAVRGLSIEDLADRAGISTGLLSQIERGIGNPSLSTLLGLAGALAVPLGSFFDGAPAESDMVVRPATRKRLELSNQHLVYELLVPDLQGSLSMLWIELPPSFDNADKPFSHVGEEAELVLEGKVEAHIGEREFLLGRGDSIRFNCAIPHWFRTFNERALVISAMTPPSF